MAPIKWDAYRSLNITSRDSGGTTCVGNNRYGKRCRWDIPGKKYSQICFILDEFETKAPAKAISSLDRLAQLSLCEEYHQDQAFEKIDEWEVAIQEATKFYESGTGMKEKNRELKEKLKEERLEREELERKFEEEMSRRKQELKSIASISLEVSSLRAKLKQSETEARDSKEVAQKMSKSFDKQIAEMERRISAELDDERQNMTTTLQNEAQTIRSLHSELKKLKTSKMTLETQVSELTLQLEDELHANSTLQSELIHTKSERDLALSQKDEFKSQLEIAAVKIDQIGFGLQEIEAARDMLSEEEQRLHARLNIENNNLKAIKEENTQLEEKYTGLVQEVGTLNAQLLSEQHSAAELRQSLQTATDNLSRTHTQLGIVKEDFSRNKDELEKLQTEFAKARDDSEKERRKLSMHQAASLARMEKLSQEMAYSKLHPFRTFFVNLFEVTISWVESVFACFGRLRTWKGLDHRNMEV
jgi:chromosome segregation ATPase